VINALTNAVRNGKTSNSCIEPSGARFDEVNLMENRIFLEEAGVSGNFHRFKNMKVHA
jgi:polyphosphate kinase